MHKKEYKFNIEQKLNEMEYSARNNALKELLRLTGKSQSQFYRWRNILLYDSTDIPTSKMAIIAKFFGCSIEEMIHPEAVNQNVLPHSVSEQSLRNRYGIS